MDKLSIKKVILSVLITLCSTNLWAQGYSNPVISGFHPDPSICRSGDDFYLVCSSFQFFPGVPIFHSKDLVNWQQIGNVLDRDSQLPLANANCLGGIYAPTIRYNDGIFYMVTTNCSSKGNFIVTATNPAGPWSEPIWLEQGGIDPSLYFENGRCYLVSNPDDGIYLCEINPQTGKQLTQSRLIWQGTGGRYPEAPHIYKKDGYYYLMIAEGGTEYAHSETIARSRSIEGPYESNPNNPILTHCKQIAQSNPIQGTGHADLIEAPDGSWWLVCLAFRPMSGLNHNLGRETFLAPVEWTSYGWPVVNGNGTLNINEPNVRTLPLHPFNKQDETTYFGKLEKLGHEWIYMRNPQCDNYVVTPEGLMLKATTDVIYRENGYPTFVARRQQHIDFTAETHIKISDTMTGDEAGVTLFITEGSHYDFYLSRNSSGQPVLKLRYALIALQHEEPEIALPSDDVTLRITGNSEYYNFAYSTNGHTFIPVGTMNTRYLSSECAGGFTGVTIGLYAQSTNKQTKAKAIYSHFKYLPYEEK